MFWLYLTLGYISIDMGAPLCICNGVIRSGSTWSFNVCRELYQYAAPLLKQSFNSAYVDSVSLEKFVVQPLAWASTLTVLKAHDIGPAAMIALRAGRAKAICTFRDPRDCVASDWAFSGCAFEICVKRVSSTLEPIRMYQSTPNTLLIRYEEMMKDRCRDIRRIAAHLGLPVDEATVQRIDAKTNIETSKKVCDDLKNRHGNEVLEVASHRIDPKTHLHDNHINGGTIGRWRHEMSADLIAYMTEYFAPWLVKLGYETQASLDKLLNQPTLSTDFTIRQQSPLTMGQPYSTFALNPQHR